MRALAVLAVIGYHLGIPWLDGGFLGVDLFFVLSGYLITSLLLIEHDRTGTVSLGNFWTRRVRRLLPASLIVLLVVVAVTAIYGDPLDAAARRPEILAALIYLVNWQFIASGQSYFEGFADVSPIRHYWSLAIEEQFYLLWPAAVLLLMKLTKGRRMWVPVAAAAIASGIAMAVLYDPSDLSRSYYGSDTRIHQILAGCLLAMLANSDLWERARRAMRPLLPLTLALVLASFALVSDTNPLYYLGGAVLFGVLVGGVIGGLESPSRIQVVLAWAPLVWIGQVSYGLYLWHWPLIRWLNPETTGLEGPGLATLQVAATFAAATLSYYLVELPIRRGRIGRLRVNRQTVFRQVPVATGSLALVAVLALSGPVPEWMQQPDPDPPTAVVTVPPAEDPETGVDTEVAEDPTVLGVVGDSVMVSLMPGIRELAAEQGWGLVEGAIRACPVGYEPLFGYDGVQSPFYEEACREAVPAAHQAISQADPDILIWHDLQSSLPRRGESDNLLEPGSEAWVEAVVASWEEALDLIAGPDTEVVMIYPPLRSQDVAGCAGSVREERCLTIQDQDESIRKAADRLIADLADRETFTVVSLDDLLCPGGYPCPGEVEGLEARLPDFDQTHFTEEGARLVSERLLAGIDAGSAHLAAGE